MNWYHVIYAAVAIALCVLSYRQGVFQGQLMTYDEIQRKIEENQTIREVQND